VIAVVVGLIPLLCKFQAFSDLDQEFITPG
jgi:hypothetical protein